MNVRISALTTYPIKGCAGLTLDRAAVTPRGVAHDRVFMLVDEDGVFLSQRRHPAMATIRPQSRAGGAKYAVSAPDAGELVFEVRPDGPRRDVSVHSWVGKGADQGDEVAQWFSSVLGKFCRLVRVPDEHERVSKGHTAGTAGFADSHAVLVISQTSLENLNAKIRAHEADSVPMNRFRPNIVIAGWNEPHTEDSVRRMAVGDVELAYAKECIRCTVPMVDQSTGRRSGPEPIRTLADYRRHADGGVSFGVKAAVLRGGELAVGDQVDVTRWA